MPHRSRRLPAIPAAALALPVALVLGLTGCTSTDHLDEYNQVTQGDARPAESPAATRVTEGEQVRLDAPVRALVASGDTVAVQYARGDRLVLGEVRGTRWTQRAAVTLPAGAGDATPGPDGSVLVPFPDGVVVVAADGGERRVTGTGPVSAAAVLPDGRLLTGTTEGVVTVRDADGTKRSEIPGLRSVDQLVTARDGSVSALSRPDTVFASIDPGSREAGPLLRAGKAGGRAAPLGAASAVVSDTTGDALLVYSTSPVRLNQMFPVPDAPWAVSDDPTRGVVWTTSTGTNRLLAYDLRDGEGTRRAELDTVRQPDSLAVTASGTVVVGSAAEGVLHLVTPALAG